MVILKGGNMSDVGDLVDSPRREVSSSRPIELPDGLTDAVHGTKPSNAERAREMIKVGDVHAVLGLQPSPKECYRRALQRSPTAEAWCKLAETLVEDEVMTVGSEVVNAAQCLQKAFSIAPESLTSEDYLALGRCCTWCPSMVSVRQAHDFFRRAVELDASLAPAWNGLGGMSSEMDGYAEVGGTRYSTADCYVKSITLDPTFRQAWYNLGRWLMDHGNRVLESSQGLQFDAITCMVRAVEEDDAYADAWESLAALLGLTSTTVLVRGVMFDAEACTKKVAELRK